MKTDALFYRLFQQHLETFFLVLGMEPDSARAMAARYEYAALEQKETAYRLDGIIRPKEPGLLLYFLEVQFYWLPTVFADLLAKAYTYLKQNDPGQRFCGVVLFADRSLEPKELGPFQALLDAGVVRRLFLDELPELSNAPLGWSVLHLIVQPEDQAAATARDLIVRAKTEIGDESLRADLVELIETVIIYKLRSLNRQEIQAMLHVHDIRETKVYQEALEEGIEKGIEKGKAEERQRQLQEKIRSIAILAAREMTAQEIADALNIDIKIVREEIAKHQSEVN